MAERGGPEDDFFVGYAVDAPPRLRRFVRRVTGAALALGAGVAILAAASHRPSTPSRFEYGQEREFVGWIRERPLPLLVVPAPACGEWCASTTSWPLTRYGSKHGAEALVRGLESRSVRLSGVLVHRGEQTLLDVVPGSIQVLDAGAEPVVAGSAPAQRVEDLGLQTLAGEVVDAKCHFGVMRPGEGKAHRSCAARCIASGAPPMLWARDREGRERYLLLVGADGRTLHRELLPYVAESVEITGRVLRIDDVWVLHAEPDAYRRR